MKTHEPRGFSKSSAIAAVCESLKIRKADSFHDKKWSWNPPKKTSARAALLARL